MEIFQESKNTIALKYNNEKTKGTKKCYKYPQGD